MSRGTWHAHRWIVYAAVTLAAGPVAAKGDRTREVHLPPPVVPPAPAAPVVAPLPPAGWNSGVYAGSALKSAPSEVWGRTLPAAPLAELASDGKHLVLATVKDVRGLAADGRELWRQPASPAAGPVFTTEGAWAAEVSGLMRLFDPTTGNVLRTMGGVDPTPHSGAPTPDGAALAWVDTDGAVTYNGGWSASAAVSPVGGVALDQGEIYVAGDTSAGPRLVRLGREGARWTAELPAAATAAPILDATQVYVAFAPVGKLPGGIAAYTRDGTPVWRYQSAYGPSAPPAAGGGLVFLPDKDGHVYALDAADGHVRWEVEGFGPFRGRPALIDGTLYAGNEDGALYAIDVDDGGITWKTALGAAPMAGVVPLGSRLVTVLTNNRVVALGMP